MPHQVDHRDILRRLGEPEPTALRLDPRRTAHLVVDMQNGFMEPGAAVEVPMARDVVAQINRISAALREAGGLNVFLQYTSPDAADQSWSRFFERLGPIAADHLAAFERGSHGWQVWPGLEVAREDIAVEKRRFSAFVPGSSELHAILSARGIDTVLVTGTMTNCCCESTARDAMQLNYRTVFVPDATAATTEHEHAATLHTLGRIFADLVSSDELVAQLQPATAPA